MAMPQVLVKDSPIIDEFLDKFDTFLVDCDGVLWSGEHVFEGVPETIRRLNSRGKRCIFVTNNSTKSRFEYHEKLRRHNIQCDLADVFCSSYSAATYIANVLSLPPDRKKVFVIGEAGVERELGMQGISVIGGTDPAYRREMTPDDFDKLSTGSALDPHVGAVLVGLDYHVNYLKIATAFKYVRQGAAYLATNTNDVLPISGSLFPSAGIAVAPLSNMTGLQPLVLGKPNLTMLDAIESQVKLDRERTCMIGDQVKTDIRFGIDAGLGGTLLVLSGIDGEEGWIKDGECSPGYCIEALSHLSNSGISSSPVIEELRSGGPASG